MNPFFSLLFNSDRRSALKGFFFLSFSAAAAAILLENNIRAMTIPQRGAAGRQKGAFEGERRFAFVNRDSKGMLCDNNAMQRWDDHSLLVMKG